MSESNLTPVLTVRMDVIQPDPPSLAQADGHSDPSPVLYSREHRDLLLALQSAAIERILVDALKAFQLGGIDHYRLVDMPMVQRERLRQIAERAVYSVSTLHTERASREAHIHARRWMTSVAAGILAIADAESPALGKRLGELFKLFIDDLLTPALRHTLVTEIIDTYQHEVSQPLPQDRRRA